MNNLYRIVNRNGDSIKFVLNPIQSEVLKNLHTRNLILKARQLGLSTFAVIYYLDEALFKENNSVGIVSYSLEHAQHIFKRIIGHALDTLPEKLKPLAGIVNRSAREITFNNGSFIRVDTTLRGGTCQHVLVSEFGKTCARNPLKAEEVITGTLQSVPISGSVIIESTGEGNEGYFTELCNQAITQGNENLSPLQYKLHFFPWFKEVSYRMLQDVTYGTELTDYFNKIEKETGETIDRHQRNWYAHQSSVLGDKVRQEYPSTPKESFLATSDAYYFQQCIEAAYKSNRCLNSSMYDAIFPVYVAMDIGVNDLTVMVFFQVIHGEIRVIDYYEDKNKGVDFYAKFLLQDKKFLYDTIFLPHDAAHRDGIVVENTYQRDFQRLFGQTNTKFIVLRRTDKNVMISNAKIKFERCVFNIGKVKPFLDMIAKYRKKWSEAVGKWLDEPLHDVSSNYADAFQYMGLAVNHLEAVGGNKSAIEKHKELVANRKGKI